MTIRAVTVANKARNAQSATWTGLLNGDTGAPVAEFDYGRTNRTPSGEKLSGACVQISGTFGAGGSVQLEGSNDGSTWFVLTGTITAAAPAAIIKTVAYLGQIVQSALSIRPNVTAGDGSTNLTVNVFMARKRA
jgi:hypothetical protein